MTGRVIAAWPSFSLIAAYELPMRQVRRAAETATSGRRSQRSPAAADIRISESMIVSSTATARRRSAGRDVWLAAWRWAQDNRAEDGSLPSGRDIGGRYGRHERWGRMVKRAGLVGELDPQT